MKFPDDPTLRTLWCAHLEEQDRDSDHEDADDTVEDLALRPAPGPAMRPAEGLVQRLATDRRALQAVREDEEIHGLLTTIGRIWQEHRLEFAQDFQRRLAAVHDGARFTERVAGGLSETVRTRSSGQSGQRALDAEIVVQPTREDEHGRAPTTSIGRVRRWWSSRRWPRSPRCWLLLSVLTVMSVASVTLSLSRGWFRSRSSPGAGASTANQRPPDPRHRNIAPNTAPCPERTGSCLVSTPLAQGPRRQAVARWFQPPMAYQPSLVLRFSYWTETGGPLRVVALDGDQRRVFATDLPATQPNTWTAATVRLRDLTPLHGPKESMRAGDRMTLLAVEGGPEAGPPHFLDRLDLEDDTALP